MCDSFTWYGETYTESCVVTHGFTAVSGGDSIVTLHLTVNYSETNSDTVEACDSLAWRGETYTRDTTVAQVMTNAAGCDSTTTLQLTVYYSTAESDVQTACDTYTWPTNHETYTMSGQHVFNTVNEYGCPKTITLTLTVNHSTEVTIEDSVAKGNVYASHGFYVSATETEAATPGEVLERENHATNVAGCDSITTLRLTVTEPPVIPPVNVDTNATVCDSFTWYGETYTESCVVTHGFTAVSGGDSIVTLHLTVNHTSYGVDEVTACDSVEWHGHTYTSTTNEPTYRLDGGSAAGCDSVVTLHLTIKHSTTGTVTVEACERYTWQGTTYEEDTTVVYVIQNVAGCDSTVMLNLSVYHSTVTEFADSVVAGEAYTGHGFEVTAVETGATEPGETIEMTHTYMTMHGCDSVVTLHLTVTEQGPGPEQPHTGDTVAVACDTYTWYGTTYTETCEATHVLTAADGTDSVVTLHLTINYSSMTHVSDEIEVGEEYSGYGFDLPAFEEAGSYEYTYNGTSVAGCDSVVVLNLTVIDNGQPEDSTSLKIVVFHVAGVTALGSNITGVCTVSTETDALIGTHVAVGAYRGDTLVRLIAEADGAGVSEVTLNINYLADSLMTVGDYTGKVLVEDEEGQWRQLVDAIDGCQAEVEFTVVDNNAIAVTDRPADVKAYTKGLTLVVKGCAERQLEVSDMIGRRLYSGRPTADEISLPLPAAGVYFVKPEKGRTIKVLAR